MGTISSRRWLAPVMLALAAASAPAAAAAADAPAITIKTDAYKNSGDANIFIIYLDSSDLVYVDVDCGYGPVEYEVDPSPTTDGTAIPCTVTAEGTVRIYTEDPELINYIFCQGGDITEIEMDALTQLQIIDLSHNALKSMDLSGFGEMQYISLRDNPFTDTPLVIGGPKPWLFLLELDMVGALDPQFDLAQYPNLEQFSAWATPSLTRVDPSRCPRLKRLSIDGTGVQELDVTQNPELSILNISHTGIDEIDVTQNYKLTELFATESGLREINLEANPDLVHLFLQYNSLRTIDVSANTRLVDLNVKGNLLTEIDLSANEDLYNVDLSENDMDFATLPLGAEFGGTYYYQQRDLPVAASYAEGMTLDLSDRVLREGTTTKMYLYAINRREPATPKVLPSTFYEYADGKVRFLHEYTDSVYVSFTNPAFPDCILHTTPFLLKTEENYGKPSAVMTATPTVYSGTIPVKLGMNGASAEHPVTVWVDGGNGDLQEFSVTSPFPTEPNVEIVRKGARSLTFYVGDGDYITSFGIRDIPLSGVNVEKVESLRELEVVNAGIKDINLEWQRWLTRLDLSGNQLTRLSLAGNNELYEKLSLSDIDLSDNQLFDVRFNSPGTWRRLDVSHNALTEIAGIEKAYYLTDLDVSYNALTSLETTYLDSIERLNVAGNRLKSLAHPEMGDPESLDCRYNDFGLAGLPYKTGELPEYLYAPQRELTIGERGPGINLQLQYVVDGQVSDIKCYSASDGRELTPEEVTMSGDGLLFFKDYDLGQVYCTLTNPAYPDFAGDDVLRTTEMTVAAPPTNCIGTLEVNTFPNGTEYLSIAGDRDGAQVFINWDGEKAGFTEYLLSDTYTIFPVTPVAGKTAGIYTYEDYDNVTVFSLNNVGLDYADCSRMTNLKALTLAGAGLRSVALPEESHLEELSLDDNYFSTLDLSKHPDLKALSLNSNSFTSFDFSPLKKLEVLSMAHNALENVTFDNPALWHLDVTDNALESMSLARLPELYQVMAMQNKLTSFDADGPETLRILHLDQNAMDFRTLPRPKDTYYRYTYSGQAPVTPEVTDGRIDLSWLYDIDGTLTDYNWCVDYPVLDSEGELTGQFLTPGEDYTVEEGVTTFLTSKANVCCVMLNALYPSAYLLTPLMTVEGSGVAGVAGETVGVRIDGSRVALTAPAGLAYSVVTADGRTICSGSTLEGETLTPALAPGLYVVRAGACGLKVLIK